MNKMQPITWKEADITAKTLSVKVYDDLLISAWNKQTNPKSMTRLEFCVWQNVYELGMLYDTEEINELIEHFNIKG